MAKQLNVNLAFGADTTKARQQIQELQKQLQSIQTTPSTLFDDAQLKKASQAAQELQHNLQSAFDVNTGKLDLTKFSANMKQAGKSLDDYKRDLISIGLEGQKTFLKLSQAVVSAEAPLLKANKHLQDFATTLKNTARWQISSSILHGFMGSLQSAYYYAQDLNESLNNIRIVTGKSVDDMANFASEANKAAQALSTTTTEYTNASLIYYQQGLSESEVKERTDVTVKMANVARESAEDVSQQMTAVWNNFDDGSKSLEYYADVMTALGAATASSTDEIAEGLEKFAAVADTVGLSYEYATSALATVTATTRQSADIVGNAFKTLFARIEGLQLGETLDDGTDLNKYSQALEAVGVNIKDTNGDMKDMDQILDELGAKWQTLGKDQQIALAQTVAGVRQYTQMVALMDNWDFFQENLEAAKGSEGTLQEQAKIYAESWEAARDKVSASAEEIYKQLLNDDFFTDMSNAFADLLNVISSLIDGFGGVQGVLLTLGGTFTRIFAKEVPSVLDGIAKKFEILTGQARTRTRDELTKLPGQLDSVAQGNTSMEVDAQINGLKQIAQMKAELIDKQHLLSSSERETYELQISQREALLGILQIRAKELDEAKKKAEAEKDALMDDATRKKSNEQKKESGKGFSTKQVKENKAAIDVEMKTLENLYQTYVKIDKTQERAKAQVNSWSKAGIKDVNELRTKMSAYIEELEESGTIDPSGPIKDLKAGLDKTDLTVKNLLGLFDAFVNEDNPFCSVQTGANQTNQSLQDLDNEISQAEEELEKMGVDPVGLAKFEKKLEEVQVKTDEYGASTDNVNQDSDKLAKHQVKLSEAITEVGSSLMSLSGTMSAMKNLGEVFTDEDATTLDKITAIIGTLVTGMESFNAISEAVASVQAVVKGATLGAAEAEEVQTGAIEGNTAAWFSNPITAIIAGALLAVTAAIVGVTTAMEANSKTIHENADAASELADKTTEEAEAKRELIASMKDALEAYKKDTGTKDSLDDITRKLAEAYNLEGDALAKLSGKYEDYQKVLNQAYDAQEKDLKKTLKKEQTAQQKKGAAMLDSARKGGPNGLLGNDLHLTFTGAGFAGGAEDEAQRILLANVSKKNFGAVGIDDVGYKQFSVDFDITKKDGSTDYNKLLELYDQLNAARSKMLSDMSPEQLNSSGIYADLDKWLDRMEKDAEDYRKHLEQSTKISAQLGQSGSISEKDIDSLSEYNKWVQETSKSLKELGYSEEEIQTFINDLVDNSINPNLKGFQTTSDAIDEIIDKGTKIDRSTLEELFGAASEGKNDYDTAALAMVNWGAVTKENYKDACDAAQHYVDATNAVKKATEAATGAKQALKDFGDGLLNEESISKLQSDIDWGKSGIIEFSEFLKKSTSEQQVYLEQLSERSTQKVIEGLNDKKAAAKETIAQQQAAIDSLGDSYEKASEKVKQWNIVQDAYKDKDAYKDPKDFVPNEAQQEALKKLQLTWDDILDLSPEEFQAKVKEGTADAQVTVDTYTNAETMIKQAQDDIKASNEQIKIEAYIALADKSSDELQKMLEEGTIGVDEFNIAFQHLQNTLDKDVDTKEFSTLKDYLDEAASSIEGLDDNIGENEDALNDVTEGLLRYDNALGEVQKKAEDWKGLLASDNIQDQAEAIGELTNVYGDLLDIDGSSLSDGFLRSAENLELLKQAAEGSEDAYHKLQELAAQDILIQCGIDTERFDQDLAYIEGQVFDGKQFPDIEVGASIDDKKFCNTLTEMVRSAGMTAQQATDYLASMGVDAEVQTVEQEAEDIHQYTGAVANVTTKEVNSVDPTTGKPVTYEIPSIEYEAKPLEVSGTQKQTSFALQVTSAKKSSGGNFKFKNSSHGSGSTGQKARKTAKQSSGSSSGKGSKAKEPEKKDHAKDEVDKYYDINNAISKVNQQLERNEQLQKKLGSMQSHYAGKTLIKSLKQENDLLKQKNDLLASQYANYQKTYKTQSQELKELKKKLGGKWNGNELQNYSQLFQENVNKYNAAIDAYNAMSAEQQEASGKQMIEDAKTAYDTYKKALERYQDLYYNEMYDTENKLADVRQQKLENQLQQIENNLEAWETDIQLKLDTTEAERNLNDFFKEIEQDFRKIFEDLTLDSAFDTKNFNTFLEDAETRIAQIKDVMAEIDVMEASKDADGVVQLSDDMRFGSISEAQEYLKKLQGELVDVGNSLNDMYEQVWDNYIKGLDQAADNFENINDEFEHLTDELEYEKELIELVYGDKAYDLMNRYYETQQKNINEQIESTRTQAEFWEDQFNQAYNMNKDKHNVDLNDMSTWTEDMKKAYDEMISSQGKLNDLILEGIQSLRDEYLNNVAKTLSDMDKAVWGMDFEDVKEDWDFIQKRADEYLDDVEGAYQIQTLANKIDTSIAETSSLKAQQKLAALREEEIAMLRNKKNLTQDDIDLAEARYQIALKEIALEDAQNNKTSMKLNRDESGNWTYQYVADEEDTAKKQQELLDAYNNLYETADNAHKHASELVMDTYEEAGEKIKEVAEDTTLTAEEKYIKIKELQDKYLPEMIAAMENANIYEQETIYATGAVFAEVCEQDSDAYDTLTDSQKRLVDEVRDQNLSDYEEIRGAILNNYGEIGTKAEETFSETNENSKTTAAAVIAQWDGQEESVKTSFQDAFDSIIKYTQNFEKELGVLEQVSDKEITSPSGVVNDFNKLGNKIDNVGNKTQNMTTTADKNLETLRGYVENVEQAWQQVVNRIKEAISVLQEYIATQSGTTTVSTGISGSGGSSGGRGNSGSGGGAAGGSGGSNGGRGNSGSGSSNGGNSQSGVSVPTVEGIAGNIWIYGEWGDDPTRHALFKEKFGKAKGEAVYNAVQALFNSGYGYGYEPQHDWDYYRKFGPSAYKTGGYTGEWDSSGKLAILHEKELVLNAEDTSNMLNAVRTVRDIAGLNDSISETIASSIGQLVLGAMAAIPNSYNTNSNENANNIFNITAEFPNADDVQTIRDAILSLPNIASQFIHES